MEQGHVVSSLSTGALLAMVLVAGWTDLRRRCIPNAVTFLGCAVALALRGMEGSTIVLAGFLGAGLALALSLPLYAMGGLGGGDVKFLGAVGAFLGPERLVVALAVTAVTGGVMALVVTLRREALAETMANCRTVLRGWFGSRGGEGRRTLSSPGAITISYGIPIGIGALAAWFF